MLVLQFVALLGLYFAGKLTSRGTILAWKNYRDGRGKPLIDATPEALAELRPSWPFGEQRWPRPAQLDRKPMHQIEAAAYARLALRGQRRSVTAGQALVVIGGAWLGVSLPVIWRMLTDYGGLEITNPAFWQLIGVLVLIELGLLISDRANDYEAVRTVYLQHANRNDGDRYLPTTPHTSRRTRLWDRLRSGK